MYFMVPARPKNAHVVGVLRGYMSKLGKDHSKMIKRVFKYFCPTNDYAI
jgi:hypothetical protein